MPLLRVTGSGGDLMVYVQIMVAQLGLEGARGAETPASKDTSKNMLSHLLEPVLPRSLAWSALECVLVVP